MLSLIRPMPFLLVVSLSAFGTSSSAQESTSDAPQYDDGNALVLPQDYRSWPFLGAGLGLTYEEGGASEEAPLFTQVFVNPSAYRGFLETGSWPDKSLFVLELREPASEVSINQSGFFPSDLSGLEAEVKDSRFDDGWAYFSFGNASSGFLSVAAPLPLESATGMSAAPCIECHTAHGAVERTFVQFYPTLFDIAREKGTLKPDY